MCFTVLIFLNILAFQYCFSEFLSHVLSLFAGFLKINCPGSRGLARLFLPQGLEVRTFFVPGVFGFHPFEKIPWGLPVGGGGGGDCKPVNLPLVHLSRVFYLFLTSPILIITETRACGHALENILPIYLILVYRVSIVKL